MGDAERNRLQRYDEIFSEHLMAARYSEQLPDDAFARLLQTGSDLLDHDGDAVRGKVVDDMGFVTDQLIFSASGAHNSDFTVPAAAGYLLDAVYVYSTLRTKAKHELPSSVADYGYRWFRQLPDGKDRGGGSSSSMP